MGGSHTSLSARIGAKSIVFINDEQWYLLKSLLVLCEMTEVIPAHGIDVCLADLLCKLRMMPD